MRYNYYIAVKRDALSVLHDRDIKEEYIACGRNSVRLYDKLERELSVNDKVTGGYTGAYSEDEDFIFDAVEANPTLRIEACKWFYGKVWGEDEVSADVTIRKYVLQNVLHEILDDYGIR